MKKRPGKIKGGFVAMTWDMLNSKAYKGLSSSSAKALPFFLGKVKEAWSPSDPVRYNTDFEFTYTEGKRLGFGKSTFHKVLRDLMQHGFIDVSYHGHYKIAGAQASSLFRLSRRWQSYDTAGFDQGEWRKHFPYTAGEKGQVPKVNSISPKSEPLKRVRGAS